MVPIAEHHIFQIGLGPLVKKQMIRVLPFTLRIFGIPPLPGGVPFIKSLGHHIEALFIAGFDKYRINRSMGADGITTHRLEL